MSVQRIKHQYELAQAKGQLPDDMNVIGATVSTILAAGVMAFHKGFYGDKEWNKAVQDARVARHEADELAFGAVEDIMPIMSRYGAIHTSSDFPLALSQIRDRVRRESYNPVESDFWRVATRRTARDFKRLRSIRTDSFNRLPVRPEGTDVTYASFGSTEDGYSIANYELAVAYTWEAYVNDDIDEFVTGLANLGVAARRTRNLVLIEAIKSIARTTPSGTNEEGTAAAGGPTPANMVWLSQLLATQTNADGLPLPRLLSDIAIPAIWRVTANQTLNSQNVIITGSTDSQRVGRNAALGLATSRVEEMMAEVTPGSSAATDWIGYASSQQWLEFAALRGYEAGPKAFTKMPDIVETSEEGSFANHAFGVKVSDNVGAKVTDTKSVVLVAGE